MVRLKASLWKISASRDWCFQVLMFNLHSNGIALLPTSRRVANYRVHNRCDLSLISFVSCEELQARLRGEKDSNVCHHKNPAVLFYILQYYRLGDGKNTYWNLRVYINPDLSTRSSRARKRGKTVKHVTPRKFDRQASRCIFCKADWLGRNAGFYSYSATSHGKYLDAQHHAKRVPRKMNHCIIHNWSWIV